MTITRKRIIEMRTHNRMRIAAELEEIILARYGEESEPFEYTEQDLCEQIRKLVYQYNLDHPAPQSADSREPWQ